jgi:hypothetical protein
MFSYLSNRQHHNVARNRQARTGLWTILSIVIAVLAILIMSTIDTPDGKPWLESTIIGQTLATLGLVLAAVLPSLLGTRKDAAVVREQVQNSHTINQRDDMDQKHDSVVELISAFSARMDDKFQAVDSNIRGVRKDVGRLADGHASMDERLRKQERVMHGVQHSVDGLDRKFAPLEVNAKTGEIQIIKPPADTVAPTEE